MRSRKITRKTALKAALAYAGQTTEAWCAERGISKGHLYQVLRGNRESAKLVAEIDSFIAEHTSQSASAA